MKPSHQRIARIVCAILGLVLVGWILTRPPRQPNSPRIVNAQETIERIAANERDRRDAELVRQLLDEDLVHRSFRFPTVVQAASGQRVLPFDSEKPAHGELAAALETALAHACKTLSRPDSPLRSLARINEASRFFEDALLAALDSSPDFAADIPPTLEGHAQRSGYPDLRVRHLASGTVFYLDPKLVARDGWASTLRSFYFEPKRGTLKITEDAVHLLIGIEHDGNDGAWKFGPWKIIDLADLEVRLKAEFQASNRDLYDR